MFRPLLIKPGQNWQDGKEELVRSVLSAIPIYLLTALRVPRKLTDDIDKARRRFLCAGDSVCTGAKCKVAWMMAARPVELGGLGVLDLERFSRALRLRWLWYSWTNPQRPWAGTALPVDGVDLSLFAAATSVMVQNGRKAIFWHSNWVNGRPFSAAFPLLFHHSRRKNRTAFEALQGGTWIRDIAHDLNNELLSEFFGLWDVLQSLDLGQYRGG